MVIFGFLELVGNSLVMLVGVKRWKQEKASRLDFYKTSLAVADAIAGFQALFVMPYNVIWSMNLTPIKLGARWFELKQSPEAFMGGLFLLFGAISSVFHLLCMGTEMAYALIKPLQYRRLSRKSLYTSLLLLWILSIFASAGIGK
ncbi:unnamed protein product [Clavelina lepadiformis]|uniref:G-protein coupled receptors family 1 profile domain-containing protein n=1 Tax=Clavelina lepadiformis TaxID=159417 RepID=A0ABP0G5K4_CLALP